MTTLRALKTLVSITHKQRGKGWLWIQRPCHSLPDLLSRFSNGWDRFIFSHFLSRHILMDLFSSFRFCKLKCLRIYYPVAFLLAVEFTPCHVTYTSVLFSSFFLHLSITLSFLYSSNIVTSLKLIFIIKVYNVSIKPFSNVKFM